MKNKKTAARKPAIRKPLIDRLGFPPGWAFAVDRIEDVAKLFLERIESTYHAHELEGAGHYLKPVEAMEYLTALADLLAELERAAALARTAKDRRQFDIEEAAKLAGKAVPS